MQRKVLQAAREAKLELTGLSHLSDAERDHLVGCRLISPEFEGHKIGRSVLVDGDRRLSVMVNEEDHVRLQVLDAGLQVERAYGSALAALRALGNHLEFARAEPWGFLTASAFNAGSAVRTSAMFHLIGLAHRKRLSAVVDALAEYGVVVRGLFGETSRAVGAFFQISVTQRPTTDFLGACDYLVRSERAARAEVSFDELQTRTESAVDFATASTELSLADALRVMGWLRWSRGDDARQVDLWLSQLEVAAHADPKAAGRDRASFVRACLGR